MKSNLKYLAILIFFNINQVFTMNNDLTKQQNHYSAFAQAISYWFDDPAKGKSDASFKKVLDAYGLIKNEKEKEEATSILQGILADYKEDHPIYKQADIALAKYHNEQIKIQQNYLQELNSTKNYLEEEIASLKKQKDKVFKKLENLESKNDKLITKKSILQTKYKLLADSQTISHSQNSANTDQPQSQEILNTQLLRKKAELEREIEDLLNSIS